MHPATSLLERRYSSRYREVKERYVRRTPSINSEVVQCVEQISSSSKAYGSEMEIMSETRRGHTIPELLLILQGI